MSERQFDPEAVDEFISYLQEEMTNLQDSAIGDYFQGDGPLRRMPAFGVGGSADTLRTEYTRFHSGSWTDIQDLLSSYQGFIDALEEIKEANADTEDANAANLEGQI